MKALANWGDEQSQEAKKEQDKIFLLGLRDAIAEMYWQIWLPEWENHKHLDPRIEKLMGFMVYAISLQYNDFAGWEEPEDLIAEFEYMFRKENWEIISDAAGVEPDGPYDDEEVTYDITHQMGDDPEEIPF